MIYKLVIALLLLATALYYVFCFLEIFGLVKFTDEKTMVKIPQMFIPFYYLLKKPEQVDEKENDDSISIEPISDYTVSSSITTISIKINDEANHGWTIELPQWINLENYSGVGTTNVVLTAKRNYGKKPRTGVITISDNQTNKAYELEVVQRSPVTFDEKN